MKKRMNLAEALSAEAITKKPVVVKTIQKSNSDSIKPIKGVHALRPPSRKNKKAVTTWHDPDVIRQLKQIGLDTDTSVQDMMSESINDFFAKNGKAQIA